MQKDVPGDRTEHGKETCICPQMKVAINKQEAVGFRGLVSCVSYSNRPPGWFSRSERSAKWETNQSLESDLDLLWFLFLSPKIQRESRHIADQNQLVVRDLEFVELR